MITVSASKDSLSRQRLIKANDYGLPLGDGDAFGFGGGSTFRLLRIVSHTVADLVISFSDPMIDIWTSRSERTLK